MTTSKLPKRTNFKPYTIDPIRWPNRVPLSDEHTREVVALLKAGKDAEAEEAFHVLCLKIHDLKQYEAFMLGRELRRKAGLLPLLPKQRECSACGWRGDVQEKCPSCLTPLPQQVSHAESRSSPST